MADDTQVIVQRVRFTGDRTGLAAIAVKGFGQVVVGQVIEVTEAEAERYTALLPTRTKPLSDFKLVGSSYAVSAAEAQEHRTTRTPRPDQDDQDAETESDAAATDAAAEGKDKVAVEDDTKAKGHAKKA